MKETSVSKVSLGQATFSIACGFIAAAILNTILLLLFAALITYRNVPIAYSQMIVYICMGLSAAVGGAFTSRIHKLRGMFWGIVAGASFFVLSYCIGVVASGQLSGSFTTVLSLLICLLTGGIGGIIGVNIKRRKKSKR